MKRIIVIILALTTHAVAGDLFDISPRFTSPPSGTSTVFTIDATNDSIEICDKADRAISFTKIGFLYGSRTGTPVQHKIGVQGQNTTTGRANGVYKTGTGECSGTFTPPASTAWNDTFQYVNTTGTTCAVTPGESYCLLINPVGTPSGANSSSFAYAQSTVGDPDAITYSYTVDGGVATVRQNMPPYSLANSTNSIGFPYQSYDQNFFSSDSTPDEYGNRFVVDCPVGCTYTVGKASILSRIPDASKQFYVSLYSGTTQLQRVTVDSSTMTTPTSNRSYEIPFTSTPLSTLSCGTTYIIATQAVSLSMNWMVPSFVVASNADLSAFTFGTAMYQTTRTNEGAWTDVTNKRVAVYPVIRKIDCTSGGVSNLGKLSGGMQ